MKERTEISSNTIIIVEGDFREKDLSSIPKDFKGDIVVNGNILFSKKICIIPCNLWVNECVNAEDFLVKGNLYVEQTIYSPHIRVEGDCFCKGDIFSNNIRISGDCICEENVQSKDITIAGNLEVKERLVIHGKAEVDVLGDIIANTIETTCVANLKAKGLQVQQIYGGGKFTIGEF